MTSHHVVCVCLLMVTSLLVVCGSWTVRLEQQSRGSQQEQLAAVQGRPRSGVAGRPSGVTGANGAAAVTSRLELQQRQQQREEELVTTQRQHFWASGPGNRTADTADTADTTGRLLLVTSLTQFAANSNQHTDWTVTSSRHVISQGQRTRSESDQLARSESRENRSAVVSASVPAGRHGGQVQRVGIGHVRARRMAEDMTDIIDSYVERDVYSEDAFDVAVVMSHSDTQLTDSDVTDSDDYDVIQRVMVDRSVMSRSHHSRHRPRHTRKRVA